MTHSTDPMRGRWAPRAAAAPLAAVVALVALAGLAGGTSSHRPPAVGSAAHAKTDLTAVVGDRVAGLSRITTAPSGLRVTPDALPAAVCVGLLLTLLLAQLRAARALPVPVERRLPLRRAPPRDAFPR